ETLAEERSPAAAAVRDGYLAAHEVAANLDEPQAATEHDRLRLRAITAQRLTLLRLREEGVIGDEAFHRLEEELDWAELYAAPAVGRGVSRRARGEGGAPGARRERQGGPASVSPLPLGGPRSNPYQGPGPGVGNNPPGPAPPGGGGDARCTFDRPGSTVSSL